MAGIGPPAACDYREGAWVHDPTAKAPYRLGREFDSNPYVKGWKYAYRSFWGLCDAELPANVSRRSTQYHWQPSSCNLRRFSAPRFCSQFVRPGVQRDIVMAGDSFTGMPPRARTPDEQIGSQAGIVLLLKRVTLALDRPALHLAPGHARRHLRARAHAHRPQDHARRRLRAQHADAGPRG